MNARVSPKRGNPKQRNMAFGAYPKEVAYWEKMAAKADRSLSWWLRSRIAEAEKLGLDQKAWDPPKFDVPQVSVSLGAYPADIDRWEKKAKQISRPRGWLIRKWLLAMDEMDRKPENVPAQPESPDTGHEPRDTDHV